MEHFHLLCVHMYKNIDASCCFAYIPTGTYLWLIYVPKLSSCRVGESECPAICFSLKMYFAVYRESQGAGNGKVSINEVEQFDWVSKAHPSSHRNHTTSLRACMCMCAFYYVRIHVHACVPMPTLCTHTVDNFT